VVLLIDVGIARQHDVAFDWFRRNTWCTPLRLQDLVIIFADLFHLLF
jgi:hypothetical protein